MEQGNCIGVRESRVPGDNGLENWIQIKNAKQVKIIYDLDFYTHPELNNSQVWEDDFLKKFDYIAGLKYQDFSNYWPVIKDRKSLGLKEEKS